MFKGAITALITPFKDGKVDERKFADFVQWQIKEGIHGLVPCGTTGESPTLTHERHNQVIDICVEAAEGKVPVIAGAGSNSTAEAINLAQHAQKAGADAILVATPYYNKPNQEGLYRHFKAIHDAADIPMILYNIPGRSVIDMKDETIVRLAELENVVGIKDATGDLSRVGSLINKLEGREFCLLSGEDATAVGFNAQGGVGVISVSSNVAPAKVVKVQELCLAGKYDEATRLQNELIALHTAMFCDSSPAPAKYAASLMGLCENELRLPLIPLLEEKRPQVERAIKDLGLI
ncbi:MAG: 4-hydroxy-tetrahydrodipicolinate synthase [Rickettsiales bacterium]|nr:4-hydroxy-tetrahydrodipicolinate synthase [Pseudomonadota bacterium]MDA0966966.1 4-hydroxy-tetrahydrodipicolinate synthase [Pseudomonadota bacterium]MDG4543885.1 4-hydroxy-tetrahydrodipicolinate synthase [Rickettsiales bacterium]MDG4546031.1 4-hydroxy-tetrahydrodipicolinate synthase [Rickettsiales bacterium]MDG4548277.1 4-hydroxy-tetrahydrodipicolinate synthase [Rickettsiales bacterium]